jgi:hypothetical protein
VQKSKKGNKWEEMLFTFQTNKQSFQMSVEPTKGQWFIKLLEVLQIEKEHSMTYAQIKEDYTHAGLEGFELFWDNKPITSLYKAGLLLV